MPSEMAVFQEYTIAGRTARLRRMVCRLRVGRLLAMSPLGLTWAAVKSFMTLTEAEAFMRGSGSSTPKASKETKYYAVAVGHIPGVYSDYASVLAQTKNCPGAKQKAFSNREEAQAYVNSHKRDASAPISLRGDISEASSLMASKGTKTGENPTKKQKKYSAANGTLTNGDVDWEPGTGPLPEGAEDGFDPTIKLDVDTGGIRTKTHEELGRITSQPTGEFSGYINVYTDGSALGNGTAGAVGGVGVYFGPRDPRSVRRLWSASHLTTRAGTYQNLCMETARPTNERS